jgi:hypothetical protein
MPACVFEDIADKRGRADSSCQNHQHDAPHPTDLPSSNSILSTKQLKSIVFISLVQLAYMFPHWLMEMVNSDTVSYMILAGLKPHLSTRQSRDFLKFNHKLLQLPTPNVPCFVV